MFWKPKCKRFNRISANTRTIWTESLLWQSLMKKVVQENYFSVLSGIFEIYVIQKHRSSNHLTRRKLHAFCKMNTGLRQMFQNCHWQLLSNGYSGWCRFTSKYIKGTIKIQIFCESIYGYCNVNKNTIFLKIVSQIRKNKGECNDWR